MAYKTAGSLRALEYIKETDYGTTPTGGLSFMGVPNKVSHDNGTTTHKVLADGSRTISHFVMGKSRYGFSAEVPLYATGQGYAWTDLLELAVGTNTQTHGDDLPSATVLIRAAADQYYLYRGCKADSLMIEAPDIGAIVTASLGIVARTMAEPSATKPITNAPATRPPLNPVIHSKYPTVTVDGVPVTIPAKSFNISIGNALAKEPGIVDGVPLEAGTYSYPSEPMAISMTYTVASSSLFWDNLKSVRTSGLTVTHDLGPFALTFSNVCLPGDDLPDRTHAAYDESITMEAANITWAGA